MSGVENSTDAARNRLKGLSDRWTWAARISQIGLFVLALGYTVYVTQSVVVPIILAWVVATIFLPIIDLLERRGVPRTLIVVILILALLAVVLTLIELLSVPLTYWGGRA